MKKSNKYNPYDDETIHYSQQNEIPEAIDQRQGFNDVIRHFDAINGHQTPKRLDHLPNRLRSIVKIIIILYVASFIGFQIYTLFKALI